jgi:hypothetical protein
MHHHLMVFMLLVVQKVQMLDNLVAMQCKLLTLVLLHLALCMLNVKDLPLESMLEVVEV